MPETSTKGPSPAQVGTIAPSDTCEESPAEIATIESHSGAENDEFDTQVDPLSS